MNKIRVVLIGPSGWGDQHARVLSSHSGIDFTAMAGRDPVRTKKAAQRYGVNAYIDVAKMLKEENPDLVSICLPNKRHYEITLQVIRSGFPLFVEKPFVFNEDEASTLLEEARKRDLFFAINFNHRYAKPVELAYRAIQNGDLGSVNFVTWRFGGEGPDCGEYENLIETQCHGFDMLEHLCGPIQSVACQMIKTEDRHFSTMSVALYFQKGAVGSLVGSYDTSYAYPDTHRVEINGDKGRILIEDTVKRYSFNSAGDEIAKVWQAGYFNDYDREFHRTFDKHFDELIIAFREGKAPPVHASAGQRALKLASACIASYKEKRFIDV